MKKLLISCFFLINVNCILISQSIDTLKLKKYESVKKFTFPFCSKTSNNCIGFSTVDVGPSLKVSGVLLQDEFALVIDSDQKKVLKISLDDGKIAKRTKEINENKYRTGYLKELIYFLMTISCFYQVDLLIYLLLITILNINK